MRQPRVIAKLWVYFLVEIVLSNKTTVSGLRLTLLGILFVAIVILITYNQRSFLLPLFVGISSLLKGWLKLLTPKFLVLLFKNSLYLKVKQLLIRSSARFVVLSHRPWRHRLRVVKSSISSTILKAIHLYIQAPLWLRTTIALGLLFATASSTYVVIALLIIPAPILNWLKKLAVTTLNRTGITQLFNAIWKFLIPARIQHKIYMHKKWTMGRRHIIAARRLRERILIGSRNTLDKNQPGESKVNQQGSGDDV